MNCAFLLCLTYLAMFYFDTPASAAIAYSLRKLTDGEIEELVNALHGDPCLWLTSSPAFRNGFILVSLQL